MFVCVVGICVCVCVCVCVCMSVYIVGMYTCMCVLCIVFNFVLAWPTDRSIFFFYYITLLIYCMFIKCKSVCLSVKIIELDM